jgi:hypothetical protein
MGTGGGQTAATSEMGLLDQMSPMDLLKLRTELANKKTYTPEQAKANQQQTLIDLGYSTPVLSNAMSLTSGIASRDEADRLAAEGDEEGARRARARAAADTASAFFPSFGGLGSGVEGAASRVGTFVPVGEGATKDMATAIFENAPRSRGAMFKGVGNGETLPSSVQANMALHKVMPGTFFGPEGALKREISDANMHLLDSGARAGKTLPLSDVMSHPQLYAEQPWLADMPVNFTDEVTANGSKIARTLPDMSGFEFSVGGKGPAKRERLLKLSQYAISDKANFAQAVRDSIPKKITAIDDAITQVSTAVQNGKLPPGTAMEYLDGLRNVKEDIKLAQTGDPALSHILRAQGYTEDYLPAKSDVNKAIKDYLFGRVAGNREVMKVRERYTSGDTSSFPYERFSDMIVLPKQGLSDDELLQFLNEWRRFGQGRELAGRPTSGGLHGLGWR